MIDNFFMIAQQVIILFILIFVGVLFGKKGIITDKSSGSITDIVLYAVTPCVMISAFQRDFTLDLLGKIFIAVLFASIIICGSILISKLLFHDKDIGRRKVLGFATVFSNCGFMSLPLQKAILGDDGWFYGSIFVAVFNLFVWTYGLVEMSGDRKQLSIKKLVFNPGIMGVTLAMILFICRIKLPDILGETVGYLANLNTPLPMLIIGFYLSKSDLRKAFSDSGAYVAIGARLVVIPILATLLMILFKVDSTITVAFVIASSAPTAATTTMFAAKHGRDTELSVSIVSATTILSILTMPFIVALACSIAG